MLLRSFILTGAIHGLFFIFLLNTKVKKSSSDQWLMLWMGVVALQLLFYYDNLAFAPVFPSYLQLLGFSLPLLSSPILYGYIRSLSFGYNTDWKNTGIHLLPYLIFNLTTFFLYYGTSHSFVLKDGYPHFDAALPIGFVYFLTALLALVPGYYAVMGLISLLKYQKSLPDNYSYTEKINLNWLKWIVISLVVLFIGLFLLIKYGVAFHLVDYSNLFAVVGVILGIYVFFIGFCGLKQNTILNNITVEGELIKEEVESVSYRNSGLTNERITQLFVQLQQHMQERKPFLQENLSLSMLAAQLAITPNQLSQVINQKTESNFFNFVNGYRVAVVKEKLKDPTLAHYSILGIAYESGFSSKSSFNKIFKATTGQTPLQYQKSTN
ncbi:AraC family transcriptional regulator [Pedobacter sp. Hv1]|uniref:helix-turn-helix domain-containing protein n=1 Tax=Pedobacter sp. Hv1 TaxID=1740090 RepID=UPI0006D8CA2A|nr:helix-turn-helix domain-containing protein [Pedobacter sp. Hv1]KQC02176.1 hypothetical protein AQF98_00960 [Pedobacter sp. Hv1]